MRLGVVLPNDAAVELAVAAEAVGIPFMYVPPRPEPNRSPRRPW